MAYSDVYNVPKKLQKKVEASANSLPKKKVPKNIIQHKYHYSKDTLVMNHERDRCPLLAHQFHSSRYHRVSASKETIFGKQELKKYENTYTPIKIHDIVPGVVNNERILYAKAIVEKDMMT
ncbi:hypothetical protein LOD99_11441 [Oopsacas minuta]|uniref:Uncharacterized protein n=1 Tax=Oopsacas minuta TaxID=111878 RepID=A0AAV7K147_9METZ|nr:hypothetical protein LOD99_11441 [Oopsacas minuta]